MNGVHVKKANPLEEAPWLTRERVLALVLLVATTIAVGLCWLLVRPFVPVLGWALALGIIARPLHSAIARRVGQRDIAAGLAVALVAWLIIAPLIFVGFQIVNEAKAGTEQVRGTSSGLWLENAKAIPWLGPAVEWSWEHLDVESGVTQFMGAVTSNVSHLLAGTVWVLVQLALVLFTLFFFFRDRHELLEVVRSLMPLSDEEIHEVFTNVADTIHATIYGSLLVALIQGTMGGLIFWFLGLPSPTIWGMVMMVLAVIPNLGTFVIWGPAAILLALSGEPGKALILAAWGAIAIGLIDNLLYPYLVGQRMRLHTLAVFFSLLGGLALLGTAGVILGPVILVITLALLDVWRRRFIGGRPAEAAVQDMPTSDSNGLLERADQRIQR